MHIQIHKQEIINKFLFTFKNTPHYQTGKTLSELMYDRKIKKGCDFRGRQISFCEILKMTVNVTDIF